MHTSLGVPDNGVQFTSKLSYALYERIGINKINTSSYHPCNSASVERVNHTMAMMLSMDVNEHQDN